LRFPRPLLDASFTKRVNRFLASILLDGKKVCAHVPNSGRMRELLTTGRRIKVREGNPKGEKLDSTSPLSISTVLGSPLMRGFPEPFWPNPLRKAISRISRDISL
jgi:hypothetical protein